MIQRQAIIDELGVHHSIQPEAEFQHRVNFLATYLAHTGLRGFVLGISGGQDSLLAGLIAQKAVDQRRAAGHEAEFHAALLPYGTQADRADALLAVETIHPDYVHDLDIQPATDALVETLRKQGEAVADFHKGNIKARMRMIAQYALAGEHRLLVVGTDHAAEAVTGFFTKFGDGGADVLPLSGLTKRQGRAILKHLQVPEVFTTKPPTADLLDSKPGQTDESELALTYTEIDDFLEGGPVTDDVAQRLSALYAATWHKRNLPVSYQPVD